MTIPSDQIITLTNNKKEKVRQTNPFLSMFHPPVNCNDRFIKRNTRVHSLGEIVGCREWSFFTTHWTECIKKFRSVFWLLIEDTVKERKKSRERIIKLLLSYSYYFKQRLFFVAYDELRNFSINAWLPWIDAYDKLQIFSELNRLL